MNYLQLFRHVERSRDICCPSSALVKGVAFVSRFLHSARHARSGRNDVLFSLKKRAANLQQMTLRRRTNESATLY
jgi:hypothetical protein